MHTDTLERRLRFAKPQPGEKRIEITADDYAVAAKIGMHGPLPISILRHFVPHRNFNGLQHRMTKLYNGTERDDPLFTRPPEQFNCFKARYQHIAYGLSPTMEELIREKGLPVVERGDYMVHRIFTASSAASLDLGITADGGSFIDRTSILAKKAMQLAVKIGEKKLIPDELLGFKYRAGAFRFFALEADRNMESRTSKLPVSNTIDRKFRLYLDLLHQRLHWGLPRLMILFITTNRTHEDNLRNHLDSLTSNPLKKQFLFNTWETFGRQWSMPDAPNLALYSEPWRSTSGNFYINRP
jgi:hypothetical protein